MRENSPTLRNRNTQVATGVGFAAIDFFLLLGVAASHSMTGKILALIPFAIFAYASFRGFRSATLFFRDDIAVARTLVRTRRFPIRDLALITTEVGQVGFYARAYVVLERTGAPPYKFRELNVPPARERALQSEADSLNGYLRKESSRQRGVRGSD